MSVPLARRALAEFVGTGGLVTVVVGSGIMAATLSGDVGIRLLANTLATVFGLGVLILMLGPISGAHFNPVVSAADFVLGRAARLRAARTTPIRAAQAGTGLSVRELLSYIAAQIAGAIAGAMLADAMFAKPWVQFSATHRSAGHLLLGETVATAGLVLLIFSLARTGRSAATPAAVAAYIGAAYWFTSSTSFANPAVTIGRAFTNTFAGIAPTSLPGFIAAQFLGAGVGLVLLAGLYPKPAVRTEPAIGTEPAAAIDEAPIDLPRKLLTAGQP
jgi:glycerol uptake facilitator-like aquaporin